MVKYFKIFFLLLTFYYAPAQRLVRSEDAVNAALSNQRNLNAANLSIQQQEQLLSGASALDNPQIFGEVTPYEPMIFGIQQSISLPSVYRNRKALQRERLKLAQLQLRGTERELRRDVRLSYLQLQYFTERQRLLLFQDSVYQAISSAARRFFVAGQINKLEELQATTQAAQVRNLLERNWSDMNSEYQIFRFYTNINDSVRLEPIENYVFISGLDTSVQNIQQQILEQQIAVGETQVKLERAEILPEIQGGISFPTTKNYERPIGYQFGITLPIWQKQNRSRVAAARTDVEIAKARLQLEQQRLNAQYAQALSNFNRELRSLEYFNSIALPQAREIMETSQRLFQGGELNYIESLRNLQSAFTIFMEHLDTHRNYNESVIQLNYLKGNL